MVEGLFGGKDKLVKIIALLKKADFSVKVGIGNRDVVEARATHTKYYPADQGYSVLPACVSTLLLL